MRRAERPRRARSRTFDLTLNPLWTAAVHGTVSERRRIRARFPTVVQGAADFDPASSPRRRDSFTVQKPIRIVVVRSPGRLRPAAFTPSTPMDFDSFAIGFDHRDRARLHALWESALDAEQWSDGPLTRQFEEAWGAWNGLPAVATAQLDRRRARRARVLRGARPRRCSAPRTRSWRRRSPVLAAGGRVEFVDCNRHDLCMSFDDFERKVARAPAACRLPRAHRRPHRVRHRADRRVLPVRGDRPDRGLRTRARRLLARPARRERWGDAGIWSFAATKTISTGEGGMLVSPHEDADRVRPGRSATTASPTTRGPGSTTG